MQESAGDLVGEEWGDDRLLLSIKEGVHPNPGAECCVHAVLSSWPIVSNADGCQAIRRRSGDGAPVGQGDGVSGAWPNHSSQPFHVGSRVTRNLMVAGLLFVSFDNLSSSVALMGAYCAVG